MKKVILFLSVMTLFLSSCEIFSSLSEKTGAISIKMPEGSERIAETYDVNEITSFTAELYDSGSSPVTKVSSTPGKSITFESLTPGSYAIVIKAFISAECAAYAEKSGIVVEAGATTYETITLFKNIIKNIESVEIAKESLDKITKNYTVGQTFALPDNVSIIAHFIHGYEKELEPNDYEIYICNAEKYTEETLVENQPLSENSRFAVIGICTESGYKYSAPVSLLMNAEEPVVSWTIPTVKDNTISFTISASASGEISYTWEKAKTADMAGKTACTSEIEIASDGTVSLPLKDTSGNYIYYLCTVTNKNIVVNGATTASRQTDVFGGQLKSFIAEYTGEYEVPGQLDDITAFKITETYADGSVSIIQSLSANYKVSYDKNLSDTERLVGNIPLVITNIAALDEAGENLTCTVTVPFKYSFDEDALDFVITADSKNVEGGTVKIAQYTGTVALSAYNNLPVYRLYDNGIYTDISNTVSYAWYADEELSTTIENGTIGNLVENVTYYYCVQTITSNPDERYVPSAKYQKSITIETEPWVIEITKDGSQVDGSSLDSGTYTLSCTNSCANGSEKITFEGKGESVTIEGNSLTIKQQADNTTATITAYINGQSAATKEYTIPAEGTYIVTFNTDGGSEVSSQTVNYNGTVATPEEPTKAGYTFAGWYTDAGCTTEYNFATSVTGNITLYAKWTVEVITDWAALSEKLSSATTDVGDIYVSGSFDVDSAINFSGTVNIIPTGSVTFTRSADCKIFDIASGATLTFAGTDSAPIVFDGNSISSKNPMIYSSGTLTLENCTLQNSNNSSNGSCGALYSSSGTTNITNCTFTSNTGIYGGAVQIYSGTVNISSITCSRNSATSGNDIYNHNGTLNIGGTVSSIDIYMNNSLDAYSPVLVPVKGITLADETYPINVQMYSCSEGTTVLTNTKMSVSEFATAINCFTLKNDGFVIDSNGKAETEPTEPTEPTGMPVSSFSELKDCLNSYSDNTATANIVISGDIEITETVTIYCNVNINADTAGRTLSRGANFTDALFKIGTNITGVTVNVGESGGTLTIDGNGNTVTASRSLINAGSSGNTVKISKNAILQNNVTSGTHGAAIYANGSTVIIEGGTVQNNDCSAKASSYGGAIYATNFKMSSGYLCGNKSVDAGGVYVLGSANITGGTISNNASNYGGGIYLVNVTNSSISGVTFESNTGTTRGGAIYIAGTSTVDITDCTFTNNVSNNGKAFAFELTGGTTSIGGKINITNDNIVIYNSDGILNISKSLEITNPIPLTIFTVTSGHQYITASEGITLSNEISKFSLQNEGYTLTKTGVVQ
ncbi:InlB B-repeat-containing protein [uncultured Treponema sp.]|uniref:InlB B-repeat-containing protein n=1 Tax=uncultured Treponema sp. TaxID=162155 RepID=UPI0025988817|nr:InlB B-repeat-containing protein [uncultured Treponema sp.]